MTKMLTKVKNKVYKEKRIIYKYTIMGRAYAIELRLRVIKSVENGMRITSASILFNVSRDIIYSLSAKIQENITLGTYSQK